MIPIRPVRLPEDRVPLLALDRSFTTDRIYHVERTPHSFALKEVMVETPIRKEFPLEYDLGADRKWELGLVAEVGGAGMRCVWLETSNLAYPAIQFYLCSGFELCGLDTALYDPASPVGGETALYFARPV